MDTLTHIVLGACIGEVIAGRQLGKQALILGAIAQNIPDIDCIASFWLPTATDVLAHRGFSHSILFALLISPILAWCATRIFKRGGMNLRKWILFWGVQIFIHIFLDAFNAYGTGWFEPFSRYRVSFSTMFVADPLFTLWPAVAVLALLVLTRTDRKRMFWAKMGIGLSSIYLVLGITFKLFTDNAVENDLHAKGITVKRYFTTPTPLNNLLWYVVAESDGGYYTGYKSIFDKRPEIGLRYVSRNDSLLLPVSGREDLSQLLRFSQGYYVVQRRNDTLVFNDMRFGEMLGWADPHPDFVFHYFLQPSQENKLIVQRGRFAGWDKVTFRAFLRRIKGV